MNWLRKSSLREWRIGPFHKYSQNPVIEPTDAPWDIKNVYNPTALVDDNRVILIFRAQTDEMTSFLALAESNDGIDFRVRKEPLLLPSEDCELPGGCEDPRISQVQGRYFLTYTGYDEETARLCLATSNDLTNWHKHGPILGTSGWSKAGAIIPYKISNKYWMYYGDDGIQIAVSNDGIKWERFETIVEKRKGSFYEDVLEVGALVPVDQGLLMIFNGRGRDGSYRAGQMLFDKKQPWKLLGKSEIPILVPSGDDKKGEVDNVVFATGLVHLNNKWLLYYGSADRRIGLAVSEHGRVAQR